MQSDLACKAATGGALLLRDETQVFQTRLDSAQRAAVLVRAVVKDQAAELRRIIHPAAG